MAGGTVRGAGNAEGCGDGTQLPSTRGWCSRAALPVLGAGVKCEADAGFQFGLDRRVGRASPCDKEQPLGTPQPLSRLGLGEASRGRPAPSPVPVGRTWH